MKCLERKISQCILPLIKVKAMVRDTLQFPTANDKLKSQTYLVPQEKILVEGVNRSNIQLVFSSKEIFYLRWNERYLSPHFLGTFVKL